MSGLSTSRTFYASNTAPKTLWQRFALVFLHSRAQIFVSWCVILKFVQNGSPQDAWPPLRIEPAGSILVRVGAKM